MSISCPPTAERRDSSTGVPGRTGPDPGPGEGPHPLIDIFEGRSQLIAYFHMWHTGSPSSEQCEGSTSQVTERGYLHSRDVSYAVFAEGPYEEASRYRTFMGYPVPWYAVPADSADRLIAGRQETWEDSPEGWPQRWDKQGGQFQVDGRPAAQWSRILAGRDDDLGTSR